MDPTLEAPPFEFVEDLVFDARIYLPTIAGLSIVIALITIGFARPRWGILLVLVTAPLQRFLLIPGFAYGRFTCQEAAFLGTFVGAIARRQFQLRALWTGGLARSYLGLLLAGALSLLGSDFLVDGLGELVILGYLFVCYTLIVELAARGPDDLARLLGAWRATAAGFGLVAGPAAVLSLVFGIGVPVTDGVRFIGTFFNPNQAGSFVVAGFFPFLAHVFDARARLRTRIGSAGVSAFLAVGGYFTASRATLLGLGVGAVLLLVLKRVRISTIVVASVLTGLGSVGLGQFRESYGEKAKLYDTHFQKGVDLDSRDAEVRLRNWQTGFRAFADNPVIGIGLGTIYLYGGDTPSVSEEGTEGVMIHNTYLSFLGETGLFGFLMLAAIIWIIVREARAAVALARGTRWQTAAHGLVPALTGLAVFNVFHYGIRARHLWVTVALTVALARVLRRARAVPADRNAVPRPARSAP